MTIRVALKALFNDQGIIKNDNQRKISKAVTQSIESAKCKAKDFNAEKVDTGSWNLITRQSLAHSVNGRKEKCPFKSVATGLSTKVKYPRNVGDHNEMLDNMHGNRQPEVYQFHQEQALGRMVN